MQLLTMNTIAMMTGVVLWNELTNPPNSDVPSNCIKPEAAAAVPALSGNGDITPVVPFEKINEIEKKAVIIGIIVEIMV